MLVTVEITNDKVSNELMSFLKKHENNGVRIIELDSDNHINIEKLVNEILELISDITVDCCYDFDKRDTDKITLSSEYKLVELHALKEILEFLSKIDIDCSFEVKNSFHINVDRDNLEQDINKLQDMIQKTCEKYRIRNDLVILNKNRELF